MTDTRGPGADSRVRRAQSGDIDRILDLLTEYGLPRAYFEPLYLADPTYQPEHSWIVEQDGQVAAHVRLFDRWIRMHGTAVHIAGVGNVITAEAFRGQGHAGRLLRAMVAAATETGFAYSILWTHIPELYARYGWVGTEQHTVRALLSDPSMCSSIDRFDLADLPHVVRIYETTNAHRTGPIIRSPEYWQWQVAWQSAEPGDCLVARGQPGSVDGYLRSRLTASAVRILELGVASGDVDLGRALVARAARARGGHVQAQLPPSLADVVANSQRDTQDDSRLMGRVLNLEALVRTLEPVLVRRLTDAGLRSAACWLATSAGTAELRVENGHVALYYAAAPDPGPSVNEGELAHLLNHGFDDLAARHFSGRPEAALLQILFPAQDFVIWPADAF